ncbi:MAG TPA: lysylphosphatidylglycerol synthase transmembrane domain-containing protein [Dehalococcoidia bacterium]|nr:hypothetical protein [Chloroflexota bacterium]MDP5877486.1 lysylphosphatidylglycerol synthase transmembrane domain-containing protein [Dehalococcoidia bacterium]MDP6274205.1 lysylphosphatidylglycerol synthase transmembrane domain-containing protein [Dehalococcoidia bacterium]MDP7159834.1 lysylphosphatidylglycerol synthase transmembrane domain-containing protein [Dehalococcoidia bacterium]MDP7213803.1 lysylphosphatidylglycerol synthase transmembrane domain-containing protein [Dehalococcoidia 
MSEGQPGSTPPNPEHGANMENGGNGYRPRLGDRLFSRKTLAVSVVAIAVLAVTAFRVLDIDRDEMWDQVKGVDPVTYLFAGVLYYISFWFRGIRWRLIVRASGLNENPNVVQIGNAKYSAIILMGWFANSVAFFRLGDAYRAYALGRETGISMASSLGTLLGERAQDILIVLGLLVVGAAGLLVTGEVTLPVYVLAAAAGVSGATLLALMVMRTYGERLARHLPDRLEEIYHPLRAGALGSFKVRQLPVQFTLGIIGWGLEIGRVYFVAESLGLDIGFFVIMSAALTIAVLSTIPTPGGFGFVEGGLTGVLIFLGLGDTQALTLTIVDRSISWISIIVIGGTLFLTWQTLTARRGRSGNGRPETPDGVAPTVADSE